MSKILKILATVAGIAKIVKPWVEFVINTIKARKKKNEPPTDS